VPLFDVLGSDDKEHFVLNTQHGFVTGVTRNRYSNRMLAWLRDRVDGSTASGGSTDTGETCEAGA
jgi:hypothetical protein